MQFAKLNSITIHYSDEGNRQGLPVVFSNSLGTDFRIWDDMIVSLTQATGDGLRFIRYDKRGHGLSDAPPAPYTMEDHTQDLVRLLDLLKVENCVIVGLSVGGMIAQMVSASFSEKILATVLSNTGHKIGDEALWTSRIEKIEAEGIAAISDNILERWFSTNFHSNNQTRLAAFRNMLERTPQAGYVGTCAAIRDCDLGDRVGKIDKPTLLIGGSEDGSTPPEMMALTHQLIAGSQFEVIDDVGHLPCVEKPVQTAKVILDFLRNHQLV